MKNIFQIFVQVPEKLTRYVYTQILYKRENKLFTRINKSLWVRQRVESTRKSVLNKLAYNII